MLPFLITTEYAQAQPRQSEGDGSKLFGDRCLTCHGNAQVEAAPPPAMVKQMTPERIYQSLTTGVMKNQAADLTDHVWSLEEWLLFPSTARYRTPPLSLN